jgi:hypothetical protein
MEKNNFITGIEEVISMVKILRKAHAASIIDKENIMPSDFDDTLSLIINKLNGILESYTECA